MASNIDFVEYAVGQMAPDLDISYKRMFGEFGVYSAGKIFAVICDNQLFVKPTRGGRDFIGHVTEAPPYPGAKPSFLIDNLEDPEWLSELVRITVAELPEAKKKKKKKG